MKITNKSYNQQLTVAYPGLLCNKMQHRGVWNQQKYPFRRKTSNLSSLIPCKACRLHSRLLWYNNHRLRGFMACCSSTQRFGSRSCNLSNTDYCNSRVDCGEKIFFYLNIPRLYLKDCAIYPPLDHVDYLLFLY